jgi:hypothetical protein
MTGGQPLMKLTGARQLARQAMTYPNRAETRPEIGVEGFHTARLYRPV